jgi:hypothetical protein
MLRRWRTVLDSPAWREPQPGTTAASWAGHVAIAHILNAHFWHCAQVAGRTNDSAGDGTTTASVLAREMIHFGLQVKHSSSSSSSRRTAANAAALQ